MAHTVGTWVLSSCASDTFLLQARAQISRVLPTAVSPTTTHFTNSWWGCSLSIIRCYSTHPFHQLKDHLLFLTCSFQEEEQERKRERERKKEENERFFWIDYFKLHIHVGTIELSLLVQVAKFAIHHCWLHNLSTYGSPLMLNCNKQTFFVDSNFPFLFIIKQI